MQVDQVELNIQDVAEYGSDAGELRAAAHGARSAPLLGRLVGIQPDMLPDDYATTERFHAKLAGYMDEACSRGWLGERTIVVFPEYIGAWLVALGEDESVLGASSIHQALRALALRHPLGFAGRIVQAALTRPAADLAAYSVFRLKAREMAAGYQATFSALARGYGVTIVAGSIVLPQPRIVDGMVAVGQGRLYNVAAVYGPDGRAHDQLVRKAYPIGDELPFISGGLVAELPVFQTPLGKLAVLICADSWYPESYQAARRQGAEIVAVPSFLSTSGIWDQPWRGYDGAVAPADVDPAEIVRLTEGQAWLRYSMASRLGQAGIRYGINVFLRGQLWDLGSDGHTIIVLGGQVIESAHVDGAALVSVTI